MAGNVSIERFIDAEKEPTKSLLPLEGYEKAPLVSLRNALASIKTPIYNLEKLLWTAERNCDKSVDSLTANELASIQLYTMGNSENSNSFYKILNQKLRSENRDELKSWYHYLKLFLTALYKLPSLKTIAWRGIRGNPDYSQQKDLIWWGFSSCAETLEVMEDFAGQEGIRTIFMIECINGKSIKSYSHYPKEKEIILMPGTYLRVISKGNVASGLNMIHLREETPPVPLLTPPFNSSSSTLPTYDVSLRKLTISERSQSNSPAASAQSYKSKTTTSLPASSSKYKNSKLEQKINDNKDKSELWLNKLNLTDDDMEIVAYYLIQNNNTFTTLHLSENRIGDKGAQHLGEGLQKNSTITELYLYSNQIGDKGVQYLSEALSYNTTLMELSLSVNQIGAEGAKYLGEAFQKNKTLIRLDLSNNQIGAQGTKYLCQGFQKNKALTILDLSKNQIGVDGAQYLSEILQRNKTLDTLILDNNQIGDKGVQYLVDGLQQNKTLTRLDLNYNQIGNSGAQYLERLKRNNRNLNLSW